MLAAALCVTGTPQDTANFKQFTSKTYRYTVGYPATWHLRVLNDIFAIENFAPSEAVRGARLPPGGAEIVVEVPRPPSRATQKLPSNLDEWVELSTAHQRIIGRAARNLETGQSKRAVIEIKVQCCAVPPYQEFVKWYFQIEDRMFSVTLGYWQGDPNAEQLLVTFREVALSLKINNT